MLTTKLRQQFVDYFRKQKHRYAVQSKVVIEDETLLFVNAGMNQFKRIFLGEDPIPTNSNELMNYQLCVRAGGKHNDLDDVGHDSYHLTSFEMLGNWSLDSYWKEKAIPLALTFLLDVCKLDINNMYVTYFEGDENIECDNETKEIWKKYISEDHIVPGNFKDNFWMMGDTGPCGMCTEIHYDLNGDRNAANLVNKDDPTVIEIWNIVFMEFNKNSSGYSKLDKKFVDTGMGLERLSMILQHKPTIYQTDTFRYIIGYAQAITGGDYFKDSYNSATDSAYRIFADHIRTVVMCLHQGIGFDAKKQGFIVRKIYRRMLTHAYIHLTGEIKCIMNNPAVKCLITDILSYFLVKKFESDLLSPDELFEIMIKEEFLFVQKISSLKNKYNRILKKTKSEELTIAELQRAHGYDLEIINIILSKVHPCSS